MCYIVDITELYSQTVWICCKNCKGDSFIWSVVSQHFNHNENKYDGHYLYILCIFCFGAKYGLYISYDKNTLSTLAQKLLKYVTDPNRSNDKIFKTALVQERCYQGGFSW